MNQQPGGRARPNQRPPRPTSVGTGSRGTSCLRKSKKASMGETVKSGATPPPNTAAADIEAILEREALLAKECAWWEANARELLELRRSAQAEFEALDMRHNEEARELSGEIECATFKLRAAEKLVEEAKTECYRNSKQAESARAEAYSMAQKVKALREVLNEVGAGSINDKGTPGTGSPKASPKQKAR